ncbi:MAG: phosphoribosyl-AMP cyclohydrolase, partial [Candidatus Limnocylindrales bacterium]
MTTQPAIDPAAIAWPEGSANAAGLLPAIVQDHADGRVLMLAWVDREALAATLASGEVHFHSRSRDRLWRKGETSGNVLRLVGLELDCDADALLLSVEPAGPTCHRGTRSCFDLPDAPPTGPQGFAALE